MRGRPSSGFRWLSTWWRRASLGWLLLWRCLGRRRRRFLSASLVNIVILLLIEIDTLRENLLIAEVVLAKLVWVSLLLGRLIGWGHWLRHRIRAGTGRGLWLGRRRRLWLRWLLAWRALLRRLLLRRLRLRRLLLGRLWLGWLLLRRCRWLLLRRLRRRLRLFLLWWLCGFLGGRDRLRLGLL